MDKKSPDAFRTISEVAEWLGVPTHVLRFWESRFSQVKPVKRAGGRRYYRPADMELLGGIRKLLHDDGMTIRGVQKVLREEGVKHVAALSMPLNRDAMDALAATNVIDLHQADAPPQETQAAPSTEGATTAEAPPPPLAEPPQQARPAPEDTPATTEEATEGPLPLPTEPAQQDTPPAQLEGPSEAATLPPTAAEAPVQATPPATSSAPPPVPPHSTDQTDTVEPPAQAGADIAPSSPDTADLTEDEDPTDAHETPFFGAALNPHGSDDVTVDPSDLPRLGPADAILFARRAQALNRTEQAPPVTSEPPLTADPVADSRLDPGPAPGTEPPAASASARTADTAEATGPEAPEAPAGTPAEPSAKPLPHTQNAPSDLGAADIEDSQEATQEEAAPPAPPLAAATGQDASETGTQIRAEAGVAPPEATPREEEAPAPSGGTLDETIQPDPAPTLPDISHIAPDPREEDIPSAGPSLASRMRHLAAGTPHGSVAILQALGDRLRELEGHMTRDMQRPGRR